MRVAFCWLLCFGAFISFTGAYGTWPFVGSPAAAGPTATPQVTMNPFGVVMGDNGGNPVDMGPTPDTFVANADWNQEPVASTSNYCGSTAAPNCVTYKYIDHIKNSCLTTQTTFIIATWAGLPTPQANNEQAFQHVYPSNPTPEPGGTPFRNIGTNTGANCTAYYNTPTPVPNAGTHPFVMNPNNAAFRTELQTAVWNQTGTDYYPQAQTATSPPYNIYEDTSGVLGLGITGGAGPALPFASEYGCGYNGGQTCRIDQIGTGTYHETTDYDSALGGWANSACPGSPCLKMTLNGAAPEGGSAITCNVFNSTTDCHDKSFTGYIDNTFEKALAKVIAANTAGNITDFDMESPIFDHSGGGWGNPALLDATLNTWINFQQDATTNSVDITDLEPGWGPGGTGDTTSSVRLVSLGMEWLTPDYSGTKSSNDRIIPRRLPIGLTTTESPSFFELFLVPFAPKQTEAPYVMNTNGTTTLGGGCPSAQGDVHGIIDILVACASDGGGVYRIEYNQLWFNHHNYGPVAVLVNTSSTDTINISSSWFQLQPEASYGFALSLAGSEMESVAQGNIGGGVANFTTCINASYCSTGGNTMALNTTATIPTTIGPHSAVILVTTNS